MKSIRVLLLTVLFLIGGIFQSCFNPCNCGPIEGDFFRIKEMGLSHLTATGKVSDGASVAFIDYSGLSISFLVDYYSKCNTSNPGPFINSALACSCKSNGELGSKERLRNLTIITVNDFDSLHSANDTINDLFLIRNNGAIELEEFLKEDSIKIYSREYSLQLKKSPELNKTFRVRVHFELTNGVIYKKESESVIFQ